VTKEANPFLIHIGYHKSATTWLQKNLFSNADCGFVSPWGAQAGIAVQEFICGNPFSFSAEKTRIKFQHGLKTATDLGLIPVLSNEALCGLEHPRTRYEKETADKLFKTFPDAKVMISIRNQKSSITSHYRQYISKGNSKTISEYICSNSKPQGFYPECQLDRFEYDLLVSYYIKLFGESNVLVILQEELLTHPQLVCDQISNFLGIKAFTAPSVDKARVGNKGLVLEFRRFWNSYNIGVPDWSKPNQSISYRLISKLERIIEKLTPKFIDDHIEKEISTVVNSVCADRFESSNKALKKIIDKDIKTFGYPLEE
jgi:hypothetical protein